MISEHADSPENVSVVNRSPTILTSTGGLVMAVPNSPNRSTVRFSPSSSAGARKTQPGVCVFPRLIDNFKISFGQAGRVQWEPEIHRHAIQQASWLIAHQTGQCIVQSKECRHKRVLRFGMESKGQDCDCCREDFSSHVVCLFMSEHTLSSLAAEGYSGTVSGGHAHAPRPQKEAIG